MSETDDRTGDGPERDEKESPHLSEQGLGATMSDEPNTMEPEEGLPEGD